MVEALDEPACQRLAAAIAAAERCTSAEFRLVVARRSSDEVLLAPLGGGVAALLAASAIALAAPELPAATALSLVAAAFLVVALPLSWPRLRLALLPERTRSARVRRAAADCFAALVAERTRACNGVLYYVSLAERQVEVIADRGIMARIAAAEWQALVERFSEVARTGRLEEACLAAIAGAAALLAKHFPASEDAGNELPDAPLIV